jgi:threonine/homoserine/homoserine lactone efflux protein
MRGLGVIPSADGVVPAGQVGSRVVSILQVLPLAFVMVAGPQILSSIFFATSEDWRRDSVAYVVGAALSISIVVTAAFLLSSGASDQGASNEAVYYVILALLLFGVVHTFRTRKTAEPPKWMGKLQTASPRFCFVLGFLLLGVFPSDLVTSISVGSFLSTKGDPWWHYAFFLVLTLLLLALPALLVLIMGRRAETFLPKVRDWMNANSWIVNELVLLLFVGIVISNIA